MPKWKVVWTRVVESRAGLVVSPRLVQIGTGPRWGVIYVLFDRRRGVEMQYRDEIHPECGDMASARSSRCAAVIAVRVVVFDPEQLARVRSTDDRGSGRSARAGSRPPPDAP